MSAIGAGAKNSPDIAYVENHIEQAAATRCQDVLKLALLRLGLSSSLGY